MLAALGASPICRLTPNLGFPKQINLHLGGSAITYSNSKNGIISAPKSWLSSLLMRYLYYENMRQDVLEIIPDAGYERILEIGGGEFPTLKALGADGAAELWGADVYAPQKIDFRFVHGSIELDETRRQIPDGYFDLILANDVLEHLVDTEQFIATVFQKLRVGGYFVCSVPNARQIRLIFHLFVKGRFPRMDSGLFDRTHLRWFCRQDVIAFAQDSGFKLVDYGASGKLVPQWLQRSLLAEFLALQNLFVFCKSS